MDCRIRDAGCGSSRAAQPIRRVIASIIEIAG